MLSRLCSSKVLLLRRLHVRQHHRGKGDAEAFEEAHGQLPVAHALQEEPVDDREHVQADEETYRHRAPSQKQRALHCAPVRRCRQGSNPPEHASRTTGHPV